LVSDNIVAGKIHFMNYNVQEQHTTPTGVVLPILISFSINIRLLRGYFHFNKVIKLEQKMAQRNYEGNTFK
jgi:hypothetical protein